MIMIATMKIKIVIAVTKVAILQSQRILLMESTLINNLNSYFYIYSNKSLKIITMFQALNLVIDFLITTFLHSKH